MRSPSILLLSSRYVRQEAINRWSRWRTTGWDNGTLSTSHNDEVPDYLTSHPSLYNSQTKKQCWVLFLQNQCFKQHAHCCNILCTTINLVISSPKWLVKTLDTFGNCHRPVFSIGVSQLKRKLTNLWKFGLHWSSKLPEIKERKNTLVAQICVLLVALKNL